jgi:hypothetical protein
MYYPIETRATPLTTVRRERVLPVPGEITVHLGDQVGAQQVVAQVNLPGEFRIVPVARLLHVPSSRASRYMRVKPGERVEKGQVIASRVGVGAPSVKSPIDGLVTASGGGRVLIEAETTLLQLRANLSGEVVSLVEGYGVVIETRAALVQGRWGSGGSDFGVLKCLAHSPDEPLRAADVDPSCHGAVLVGGAELEEGVLDQAEQFHVRGIVTGGLSPEQVPQVRALSFPVVVTEGVGTIPMAEPLFRILTTNDGREAAIGGEVRARWGVVRPEVIIPLPASAQPRGELELGAELALGARVRILRAPYLGATGEVVGLPARARAIQTGGRVRGADVDIGQAAPVFVPVANLEILC